MSNSGTIPPTLAQEFRASHPRVTEEEDDEQEEEDQEEEQPDTEEDHADDDDDDEGDEEDQDEEDEAEEEADEEEEDEADEEEEEEDEEDDGDEDDSDEEDQVVCKATIAGETLSRVITVPHDIKFKAFMTAVAHKCGIAVPKCATESAKCAKKPPKKKKGEAGKSLQDFGTSDISVDTIAEESSHVCYVDNDGDTIVIDSAGAMKAAFDAYWSGQASALRLVVHRPAPLIETSPSKKGKGKKAKGQKPPPPIPYPGGGRNTPSSGLPPTAPMTPSFNQSSTSTLSSPMGWGASVRAPTPIATTKGISSELLMGRTASSSDDIRISSNEVGHTFDGLQQGQELVWTSINVLGRGSFGIVHEGLTSDGLLMAVKEVDLAPDRVANGDEMRSLIKEINLMRTLSHRNIVQYWGCQTKPMEGGGMKLEIFLEYCPGGSLATLRKKYNKHHGRLSIQLIRHYARSVLEGLAYLHSQGIIHRDIKCDNVLIDSTGEVKLADFGCSRRVATMALDATCDKLATTLVGTPLFMAPEMVNSESGQGYSFEADVWGLGCLVIEMFGNKPWRTTDGSNNIYGLMFKIASSNETPNGVPPDCDPLLADFFANCFVRDPKKRKKAHEMLEHSWMTCPDSQLVEPREEPELSPSRSPGRASPQPVTVSQTTADSLASLSSANNKST